MIEFLILGLATWRISSLVCNEDGPWYIFLRLRKWVGIQYDEVGRMSGYKENLLAGALSCLWCSSIWVAIFWAVFYLLLPQIALPFAGVFALSAIAIVIDKLVNR